MKYEKKLVKSLIYGLIIGIYFSILTISDSEQIRSNDGWYTERSLSIFEYIQKLLQTSVIISIALVIIVAFYLYYKDDGKDQ